MIITTINQFKNYISINENFKRVIENYERLSAPDTQKGKYPINDEVFAVVNSYESAEAKADFFENHHQYIDIQCFVSGSEEIHIANTKKLSISKEYDEEADYELFKTPDEYSTLILSAGDIAVFFPGEAHRPGVMKKSGSEMISKVIFKIKI